MHCIKLAPALSFEYQNTKFTAKDGTAWYGSYVNGHYTHYADTKNQKVIDFSGKDVMAYQRVSYAVLLGADFWVSLPKNFEFFTGFFASPYIYAISYDNHLLRYNNSDSVSDFADITQGFFGLYKWNAGLSYTIAPRHSISLTAQYVYMRVLRGEDYQKKNTETTYALSADADGGASAKWLSFTLSYRFTFF